MPIVSSAIVEDSVQEDGRRYIRELHVDDLGVEHRFTYLGPADTDAEETLALRAELLDGEITDFPPE